MSKEKRPFDLPEIMQRVVSAVPDAKLLVVGGGNPEMEEELKKNISDMSLNDHVSLEGFQKDVSPYYRDSSVYLSTSEYEGFSVSIGEAQIYGLPVVGYDLFYLSILKSRKGSLLAPLGRVDKIAEMIIKLFSDPAAYQRVSEEALENISQFNVDMTAQWKSVFTDILEKRAAVETDHLGKLSLDTIRQQATLRNSWDVLNEEEKSSVALEIAFPTPKTGPAKNFRRKAALLSRVLLIDGLQGVKGRISAKRDLVESAK